MNRTNHALPYRKRRIARLLALFCFLAVFLAQPAAQASPPEPMALVPFITGFNIPTGIATDLNGNIFVRSAVPNSFDPQRVYRFTSTGSLSGQTQAGTNGLVIAALATDPTTGLIWSLSSVGGLALIHPNTLQGQPQFTLNQLPIDASDVF